MTNELFDVDNSSKFKWMFYFTMIHFKSENYDFRFDNQFAIISGTEILLVIQYIAGKDTCVTIKLNPSLVLEYCICTALLTRMCFPYNYTSKNY